MLKLSGSLLNQPVLSLRTGDTIAVSESLIINPNNLKIEGLYCIDNRSRQRLVLLTQDIRDSIQQGLVVDDYTALTEPLDLIRLEPILKLEFELIGKPVQTAKKQKVGKVTDFAADDQTLYIQKLYVSQSLIKSLSNGQLSIDRNDIVEVTNKRIVIKELQRPTNSGVTATAPAT